MKRLTWRFGYYLSHFIEGDQEWGTYRLITALAVLFALMFIGRMIDLVDPLNQLIFFAQERVIFVSAIANKLRVELVSLSLLRYMLTPTLGVVLAIFYGISYIQDIFELESFGKAKDYLLASLFAWDYPTLTIRNGKKEIKDDEIHIMDGIGGPGYLIIKMGNAVLLERGRGPTSVLGAGKYFVRRFETIRDIVDLREMYHKRLTVSTMTKDGIEIVVRDVEATFRIDTGKQQQRTETSPYPFSMKAVRAAVYGRMVNKEGKLGEWSDNILSTVSGQVNSWIARQKLDRLTAPANTDPRAAIRQDFNKPKIRNIFRNMGAEIIWINIGHVDTPDEVDKQRIDTWQSFWKREKSISDAHGEAMRIAYQDMGHSEGQADMLITISRALESAGREPISPQQITDLILLRISQTLEAMTSQPGLSEQKLHPPFEKAQQIIDILAKESTTAGGMK